MQKQELENLWYTIPVGAHNALDYMTLCSVWDVDKRKARAMLHDLSTYDNGDDFVLIRSAKNRGFYLSDDPAEIKAYRAECLRKGRSVMAAVSKCNRILKADAQQLAFVNNMRSMREAAKLKQVEACQKLSDLYGMSCIDVPLLSKIENGIVHPTQQLVDALAHIYGVEAANLFRMELAADDNKTAHARLQVSAFTHLKG